MTRLEVERAVVEIFRRGAMLGSERECSLEQPLGDQGLGLDSLALVGVVTQLERAFSVVFPESFWSERPQLTLRRLADILLASGAESRESLPSLRSSVGESPRTRARRWAKMGRIIHEQGLAAGLRWGASRLVDHVVRLFYERETFFLLAFDLDREPLPRYTSSLELELRELTPAEAPALDALWKAEPRMRAHRSFRARLAGQYIRLAAWHEGQMVGIDLLSAMGVDSSMTGLKVRVGPGACWGQALHERRSFEGMGVGLSLLAFSLAEARRRGYRRQLTYVSAKNLRMLSAAVHLLGFHKIGQIETTWILRRPFSRWQVGEHSGRGGTLAL